MEKPIREQVTESTRAVLARFVEIAKEMGFTNQLDPEHDEYAQLPDRPKDEKDVHDIMLMVVAFCELLGVDAHTIILATTSGISATKTRLDPEDWATYLKSLERLGPSD